MQFQMNGKMYDVMFQYVDVPSKNSGTMVKETHCFISSVDPNKQGRDRFERVVETIVVQNPVDHFVKATGRRKALDKALRRGTIVRNRDQRRQVWNRYFETHSDLRK